MYGNDMVAKAVSPPRDSSALDVPTSLSEAASSFEQVSAAAGRVAVTAARLHDARQQHDHAIREYSQAMDRLSQHREKESL